MSAPAAPALEVRDLSVAFGGLTALDRVTFAVRAGVPSANRSFSPISGDSMKAFQIWRLPCV